MSALLAKIMDKLSAKTLSLVIELLQRLALSIYDSLISYFKKKKKDEEDQIAVDDLRRSESEEDIRSSIDNMP